MSREGGWNLLCKFFDNMGPIPHHMHQSEEQAALLGRRGKPEAYYFPPQYNETDNDFPYTFMGLAPGTTKAEVRRCLENWNKGDNGILFLSHAYRLEAGHRMADQPAHSARARLARDLRAAGEQRRLLDVPVGGRRTHHTAGAAGEGCPGRIPQRPRLSGRAARLGRERESDVRRRQPRVPHAGQAVCGNRRGRLSRAVGLLWHAVVFGEGADGRAEAYGHASPTPKPTA